MLPLLTAGDSFYSAMQVTSSIVLFNLSMIISIYVNNVLCEKTKTNDEELKSQKFPPCAACRILTNSFRKVNISLYWVILLGNCLLSIIKYFVTQLKYIEDVYINIFYVKIVKM